MKNYTITVNGIAYNVTVEENNAASAAPSAVPAASAAGKISVEAPMPGNILDIKVKSGDTVKSGQTLVILEAMKMENDIVAPGDGVIASVNVNKGDTVEAGQVIATLN